MTLEPMLRAIAGSFVAASVLLGMYVHPVLPVVHAVRRPEPAAVGLHQLVPDDLVPPETGRRGRGGIAEGADGAENDRAPSALTATARKRARFAVAGRTRVSKEPTFSTSTPRASGGAVHGFVAIPPDTN